jgi:cytochrome c biogenesis protein CcmG, thiol:disulfide interchange protein DsbE
VNRRFEIRNLLITLAVFCLVVGAYLVMHSRGHRDPARFSRDSLRTVPDLSFTDLNGRAIHTTDYKNKVVLVNFWAAWCVPCAEEVPQFVALQKKYRGQGLQVIGFSVDDDAQELQSFYRKYQMNYPVVPSDIKLADAFGGVLGLPTTFVIGRDSQIHTKHTGVTDFSALEREVVTLLKAAQN